MAFSFTGSQVLIGGKSRILRNSAPVAKLVLASRSIAAKGALKKGFIFFISWIPACAGMTGADEICVKIKVWLPEAAPPVGCANQSR
ncbi:MAG: hypothetical protein HOL37_01535 [Rhodospirillaceae bacterium]|nr:hypothetical protein [Rhodospirillaceae bacterium]MBT7355876.1 hypothetical protein [Rhodospirillaceae bacterium]